MKSSANDQHNDKNSCCRSQSLCSFPLRKYIYVQQKVHSNAGSNGKRHQKDLIPVHKSYHSKKDSQEKTPPVDLLTGCTVIYQQCRCTNRYCTGFRILHFHITFISEKKHQQCPDTKRRHRIFKTVHEHIGERSKSKHDNSTLNQSVPGQGIAKGFIKGAIKFPQHHILTHSNGLIRTCRAVYKHIDTDIIVGLIDRIHQEHEYHKGQDIKSKGKPDRFSVFGKPLDDTFHFVHSFAPFPMICQIVRSPTHPAFFAFAVSS